MNNEWVKHTLKILKEIITSTTLYPSQYVSSACIVCEAVDWYIGVNDRDTWSYACFVNSALSNAIEQLKISEKNYGESEIQKVKHGVSTIQHYVNYFIEKSISEDYKSYWKNTQQLTNEILDILQLKWECG